MYQTIFFDLDGTLTESAPGITRSVAYALKKWGIEVEDLRTLEPFVGPPLAESFARYFGFTPEQCSDGIRYYREYYVNKGLFENSVYPGIEDMLRRSEETPDGSWSLLLPSRKSLRFRLWNISGWHSISIGLREPVWTKTGWRRRMCSAML